MEGPPTAAKLLIASEEAPAVAATLEDDAVASGDGESTAVSEGKGAAAAGSDGEEEVEDDAVASGESIAVSTAAAAAGSGGEEEEDSVDVEEEAAILVGPSMGRIPTREEYVKLILSYERDPFPVDEGETDERVLESAAFYRELADEVMELKAQMLEEIRTKGFYEVEDDYEERVADAFACSKAVWEQVFLHDEEEGHELDREREQ